MPNGLKMPNVVFTGSVTIFYPAQQELNRVQREIRNDNRWPVLTVGSKAILLQLKTQHQAGLWTWERRSNVVCLERDHSLGSTASFQRNPKSVISGVMLVCSSSYFWGNLKGKDQRNSGCSVNRGILEICLHLCCYTPLQAIHFSPLPMSPSPLEVARYPSISPTSSSKQETTHCVACLEPCTCWLAIQHFN